MQCRVELGLRASNAALLVDGGGQDMDWSLLPQPLSKLMVQCFSGQVSLDKAHFLLFVRAKKQGSCVCQGNRSQGLAGNF